jgi:hypothetical protein
MTIYLGKTDFDICPVAVLLLARPAGGAQCSYHGKVCPALTKFVEKVRVAPSQADTIAKATHLELVLQPQQQYVD